MNFWFWFLISDHQFVNWIFLSPCLLLSFSSWWHLEEIRLHILISEQQIISGCMVFSSFSEIHPAASTEQFFIVSLSCLFWSGWYIRGPFTKELIIVLLIFLLISFAFLCSLIAWMIWHMPLCMSWPNYVIEYQRQMLFVLVTR